MNVVKQKLKGVSGVMWACLIMVVLLMIFVPNYSQLRNFDNILKNTAILVIVSIGMTMSILGEEIDLSIGGVMSAAAMISAIYIKQFENPSGLQLLVGFLIGMLVGAVFGFVNGLLIGKFKFNFWLVTFATMSMEMCIRDSSYCGSCARS